MLGDEEKPSYGQAVVLEDISEQTDTEWVLGRSEYIGASETSAVLGISKYASPVDIWMRKTGRGEEIEVNYRMKRGNHMEPFILEELAINQMIDLDPANHRLQHPDWPFICTNLDGWDRLDEVPLEAKATSSYNREALKELEAGNVQEGSTAELYYHQIQHQMMVTGAPFAWLAADCDGKLYDVRIPRDQDLINVIEEKLVEFWQEYVEKDIKPDYGEVRADSLRQLYAPDNSKVLEVDSDSKLAELLKQRHHWHEKAKGCWDKRDELDAQIMELAEDAKKIQAPNMKATRVVSEYKRFDSKSFRRDHPELYEQYKTNTVHKDYWLVKEKN